MIRYPDCQRDDGNCSVCSLTSYNRDCHNNSISPIAYYRNIRGLTQQQLADTSGLNIRSIQKLERGERDIHKAELDTAIALADALGVDVRDLI